MAESKMQSGVEKKKDFTFLIANKYQLIRKIGSGSFGDIHLAVNTSNHETVAVKLEKAKATHPQLFHETQLYKLLEKGEGFARAQWYGLERGYNILVMDLLGPSLGELFNTNSRKFSVKTVMMITVQMISLLEYLHSKFYIHGDIKPENFLMGIGDSVNKVYLIDFGLAKKYRDSRTGNHIPFRHGLNLTGTARYVSINNHHGTEQSRRDDMESLGYLLFYFLRGSLPWDDVEGRDKKHLYKKIKNLKMNTPVKELCEGFPGEFGMYLNYCRRMRFEETPAYDALRELFRRLFEKLDMKYDYVYDWSFFNKQSKPGSSDCGQKTDKK